uniref:Uncharacterized protein n=1 Tax=Cuerna arida TaxID=1464854 RepID=A0A1B6GZW4_9HEMI
MAEVAVDKVDVVAEDKEVCEIPVEKPVAEIIDENSTSDEPLVKECKTVENGTAKNGNAVHDVENDDNSIDDSTNGVCNLKRKSISEDKVSDEKDSVVEKKLKVDEVDKNEKPVAEVKNGDVEKVV